MKQMRRHNMWTEITRPKYERSGRRYASDATDEEWCHIAPLLPPAKSGGRPRTTDLRDVFDAILYMASTGCQWRMLPNDFPPVRSEEHTSELQSLMSISYAVFCLKKNNDITTSLQFTASEARNPPLTITQFSSTSPTRPYPISY